MVARVDESVPGSVVVGVGDRRPVPHLVCLKEEG